MRSWKRSLTYVSVILVSSLWMSTTSAQASESLTSKKIDLAGRQRMLSQRIAKASCYIGTFTDVPKHVAILRDSIKSFEEAHHTLKYGSQDQQFSAENNPVILAELEKLDPIVKLLNFASTILIETSHLPGLDVDIIAELNQPALDQANLLVKVIEQTSAETSDKTVSNDLNLNKTIDLAGRQRMLIQKATKEFCFIAYGLNVPENEEKLTNTILSLDGSLNMLIEGNSNQSIAAAPTVEITNQLKRIKSQWLVIRRIMEKTANNDITHSNDFKIISHINEPLMEQMDKVVKLYVEHSQLAPVEPEVIKE